MDDGLGVQAEPQRVGTGIGPLVGLPDVGEDGVRVRRFFLHLGLGHTSQPIPLPIQDVGNGPHRGHRTAHGPSLLRQSGMDRLGRDLGIRQRRP